MAATLEQLEKRVAQMEQELASLRQRVETPSHAESPADAVRACWRRHVSVNVTHDRLLYLMLGAAQVVSVLVRRKEQRRACAGGVCPRA